MMNDNWSKDHQVINELRNTITKLELEIEELKKRLELKNITSDDLSRPLSLNEYYLGKYLEIHNAIYNMRLNKLQNSRLDLEQQYQDLKKQLDHQSFLKSNEELKEEYLKREQEIKAIQENYQIQLTDKQTTLDSLIKEIENARSLSKRYTIEYYENLIQHLDTTTPSAAIEYLDFVMSVVQNSLYDQNVEIGEKMQYVTELSNAIEDFSKLVQIENTRFKDELNQKQREMEEVDFTEIMSQLDDIEPQIEQIKQLERELDDLFKEIKLKHVKEITDRINYMQLMQTDAREMAQVLDQLMEKDYPLMLKSIDTLTNSKLKNQKELEKLQIRKLQLEQIQKEYEVVLNEYNNLQSMYDIINQNITQIEEYATFAMKAIEAHAHYLKLYEEYASLSSKNDALLKDIDNLSDEVTNLKETRRSKVLDPYARPIINQLNEKIAMSESKIERSQLMLEKVLIELEDLPKTKEDTVLINVIKDKEKCEKHLPDLYNKQRDLMLAVEDKYERLQDLKKELEEYDLITEKIEELLHENNV